MTTALCLSCNTTIINPAADPTGVMRCSNCKEPMGSDASSEKSAAIPSEVALGAEPVYVRYSYLRVAAWLGAAFLISDNVYSIATNLHVNSMLAGMGKVGAGIAVWSVASDLIRMVVDLAIGLSFVWCVRHFERMDAGATEMAWRCGSLVEPLGPRTGSNLPVLLPFCVAGGTLFMLGLGLVFQKPELVNLKIVDHPFAQGLVLASTGAVFFCMALGLGELRLFFHRMRELGTRLNERPHGLTYGLTIPTDKKMPRAPSYSLTYAVLFCVSALLVVSLGLWIVQKERGSELLQAGERMQWAMFCGGTLLLTCIGVFLAILRLTADWRAMLLAWEVAAATVARKKLIATQARGGRGKGLWMRRNDMEREEERRYHTVTHILGVVLVALFAVGAYMLPAGTAWYFRGMAALSGVGFGALMLWLSSIRNDVKHWLVATVSFGGWAPAQSKVTRICSHTLMVLGVCYGTIQTYLFSGDALPLPTFGLTKESFAGLKNSDVGTALILYGTAIGIGAFLSLPVLLTALSIRDLDRGASSLELWCRSARRNPSQA